VELLLGDACDLRDAVHGQTFYGLPSQATDVPNPFRGTHGEPHAAQHFQQRAAVVLLAAGGQKNKTMAQEMATNHNTVAWDFTVL